MGILMLGLSAMTAAGLNRIEYFADFGNGADG